MKPVLTATVLAILGIAIPAEIALATKLTPHKGAWVDLNSTGIVFGTIAETVKKSGGPKGSVTYHIRRVNGRGEFEELDSKKVFEAAERGDKIAIEAFEITGEHLGQGLGDTVCHLSPEAIFLFGGPTAAGDFIFKPTKDSMERHVLPIFRNKVEILPSKLKSGSAAIVGASALVWKELEKE
jgi:predicted NBD/HSP70 family sugar kinase